MNLTGLVSLPVQFLIHSGRAADVAGVYNTGVLKLETYKYKIENGTGSLFSVNSIMYFTNIYTQVHVTLLSHISELQLLLRLFWATFIYYFEFCLFSNIIICRAEVIRLQWSIISDCDLIGYCFFVFSLFLINVSIIFMCGTLYFWSVTQNSEQLKGWNFTIFYLYFGVNEQRALSKCHIIYYLSSERIKMGWWIYDWWGKGKGISREYIYYIVWIQQCFTESDTLTQELITYI